MPAGDFAQAAKKLLFGQNHAHVGGDGFDDDGGDFVLVLRKEAFDSVQVVVGRVECQGGERLRDAGTFGNTERGQAGTGLR